MNNQDYFKNVLWDPVAIEDASMAEIDRHIEDLPFDKGEKAVVKRIIHTSGDLSLGSLVKFHPRAVAAGLTAIKNGATIFTDVNMVRSGINSRLLQQYGGEIHCGVDKPEVEQAARRWGITRSAAAMRLFGSALDNQLIAIGNAPTALFELLKMVEENIAHPALIVGIPVGFVGAKESKELLTRFNIPYITLLGTKGGSPLAVASINALIYLLEGERGDQG